MKLLLFGFFHFICIFHALSQINKDPKLIASHYENSNRNVIVHAIRPNWEIDSPALIGTHLITKDSVFVYDRRNHNRDSTLAFVGYFDSSGNKMETDEFTFDKGRLWRITNYAYEGGLLFKKEEITQSTFTINGSSPVDKNVSTYDYDSLGNNVAEKLYSHITDSSKRISVTAWQREFDRLGHVVKEFEALPNQATLLLHKYYYVNGKLSVVETYDKHEKLIYSWQYKHDNKDNSESIFLVNHSPEPEIQRESYFDDQNRLIKEELYNEGPSYADYITEKYVYDSKGLVAWQSYQDIGGNHYYFRHFYTPPQYGGFQMPMDSTHQEQINNLDYDKIFTKVEIESEYPGGPGAWSRFLINNLHYPVPAVSDEIQGDVIVVFIVDKEGNISDIHPISGPPELRQEAVRVIKKSGKWTAAVENGRQVKSYKQQPIRFRLESH
jgi:TonB family protein